MNYELAKKLKDVGFPQNSDDGRDLLFPSEKESDRYFNSIGENWEFAYEPTLSELIEACGEIKKEDKKFVLWYSGMDWRAGYYEYGDTDYIDDYPDNVQDGKTPEEAVANLWLELNKK